MQLAWYLEEKSNDQVYYSFYIWEEYHTHGFLQKLSNVVGFLSKNLGPTKLKSVFIKQQNTKLEETILYFIEVNDAK